MSHGEMMTTRSGAAHALACWAAALDPSAEELALADRSLVDTVAVGLAAHREPVIGITADLPEEARWAFACHILDFDDLHMPSTSHISTVCVPVALALGGGARTYLAGAGVMARLGIALGWPHYSAGWHATTTCGALGAAAGAAVALGLDAGGIARAMALAVPAAGGVQRSFGTDGKPLQVGFATHAGVRAARLAAAGASADPRAVDDWLALLGGSPDRLTIDGPTVPGGLAVKLHPCCYALQRPIGAAATLRPAMPDPAAIRRIVVRTPRATVQPLIHHRPDTGLQAKFSLEYAVSAALLDEHVGFAAFTDDAVHRPPARRLVDLVETELTDGGDHLLAGEVAVEVHTDAEVHRATLAHPPGSPQHPPLDGAFAGKVADCLAGLPVTAADIAWDRAADLLRAHLGV
ncbi:MmgE/PrpD family protein [Dactylosporangium sp. NPDC006015]|uniref:MmgE/PrpD family protein n=1 Tax=Dactylosporangium sp. NPDC006015 TaxID=3154576 RepID=UPI0033AA8CD5